MLIKRIFSNKFNSPSELLAYLSYVKKMWRGFYVAKTAILEDRSLIRIKRRAEIQDYVIIRTFTSEVRIGEYTQINPYTVIYGGSGVFIGDNVMIAPHCVIAAGNHDYTQLDKPMRQAGNLSSGPIVIGDGVWIGANCTITDGVSIGHDALVGANSVVTKDIEPYDIVAGVPARVLGNRRSISTK
jgi:acetyltransferase-like isoleucine patch superfamily enzyme